MDSKLLKLMPDSTKKERDLIKKVIEKKLKNGEKIGAGFFDDLKRKAKAALASTTGQAIKSAVFNKVQNAVIDKVATQSTPQEPRNEKWDYKLKPGELHQVYVTKGNQRYNSKFSGPGTHVISDVKDIIQQAGGDINKAFDQSNFSSKIDLEAAAHDIRYVLASNGDPNEVKNKVRAADEKFISVLSKISDLNAIAPLSAMISKVKAEQYGLPVYAGDEKASPQDLELITKVLNVLEQKGLGQKRPKRGGASTVRRAYGNKGEGKKLNPWMSHLKKTWDKNKGKMSYSEAMTLAKGTYKC